jgi:hypothetical protein
MPLMNQVLFAFYFIVSIVLVVTHQRFMTIFSAVMLAVLNFLRLWVWWKHGRHQKNMYANFCRAFISIIIDIEILLISIKIDDIGNLRISTLCAIMWLMLPFFVTTGILTFVALISRIVATCHKRDTPYFAGISVFIWLFLVFGGGPSLLFHLVYEVQVNSGTTYNFTPSIRLASLLMGCYGLTMFIFHLIIAKSFR